MVPDSLLEERIVQYNMGKEENVELQRVPSSSSDPQEDITEKELRRQEV